MSDATQDLLTALRAQPLGLKLAQIAQRVRRPAPELEAALGTLLRRGQAFQPLPGLWLPLPFQKANGHVVSIDRKRKIAKDSFAAAQRSYYVRNRDKVAAAQRAWRRAHPDKVAAAQRSYYVRNRDKVAAAQRSYYVRNRDKWKTIYSPRQAAKRAASREGRTHASR